MLTNAESRIGDRVELNSFADELSLADAVGMRWMAELQASSAPIYSVALSGGRITRRFFSSLTELSGRQNVSLDRLHFFWGDERCVPPTDQESNYGMAQELLLSPLRIQENQIHRIRGEENPTEAALEAESALRRSVASNADGQPVMDMVFLGMGEDGHVASLFPGETEASVADPGVYRAVVAEKPPPVRITLGYATIAAARQVWVLASGKGKEGALKESLSPNGTTPLARVIRTRSKTNLFTDIRIDGT